MLTIYVFIDECHRTQGGMLHEAMKHFMGNDVMLIGFTGTPLLHTDKKKSIEPFGSYIHSYKFNEAVKEKDDDAVVEKDLALNQGEMLLLAIATSIDALAVGIMFAFTYDSLNIYWAIAIIGLTTFVLSIIGVIVGNFFGNKYKKKSEIAGGIILILIGVKILLEHLGIISF